MKLILCLMVVMYNCARLSSAPADSVTESTNNNNSNNDDWQAVAASSYIAARTPNMAYVSDAAGGDEAGATGGVVFQFRRSIKSDNTEIEARRRSALDKGFMRFGRSGGRVSRASPNMMRFGRSSMNHLEYVPDDMPRMRKASAGNMMRFGRGHSNLIRFGRNYVDDKSSGDDYNDAGEVEDFIDMPEQRSADNKYDEYGKKILRLGRSSAESASGESYESPPENVQPPIVKSLESGQQNKKATDRNTLRFGRSGNMMRFGRASPGNMMRFGRAGNMMRFGRAGAGSNVIRFGRSNPNIMRFGRTDKNLMRFGKRSPKSIAASTKIYCEDDNCYVQEENVNQLLESDSQKDDQLQQLFGSAADEGFKQDFEDLLVEK